MSTPTPFSADAHFSDAWLTRCANRPTTAPATPS